MLATFPDLLAERRAATAALGAFTCYNATTGTAVVRAAEARSAPVVLLVSRASFMAPGGRLLIAALSAIAAEADCPACVQLDHVNDPDVIAAALDAGAGAIMADGSRLPFGENVAFTRRIAAAATAVGAHVEAELGHIEGGEDVAAAVRAGQLTAPLEAARLAEQSGLHCLAVSIGNVHGAYAAPPRLDWARLEGIRDLTGVPLSLHGASGLPDDDLHRAISLGICKVNVNTELRARYLERLPALLARAEPGHRVLELEQGLCDAISEVVDAKLAALSPR